ncbi:MAG: ABC transporter permease, partial [Gaiellales bacterium]
MIRVALRGLLGRKLRSVLTAVSIVLGTAMISGTFVVNDQINSAFSDIFKTGYEGIDVVLSHRTEFTGTNGQGAGPLPAALIDRVRAVPGVAKADGQIQASGSLVVNGKYVKAVGGAPTLVFSYAPKPFDPNRLTAGSFPRAHGQVAVIQKLADDQHLHVGQRVQIATEIGAEPVTISGIFKYGNVDSLGGATVVVTTFADAQRWYDRVGKTSLILAAAKPGVTPQELKRRIRAAMPPQVKVQTGAEAAKEATDQVAGSITGFLTPALLAFAGAAVFVGAFIIFNTFSITVAQRMREFAMLRTIGATRGQVLRSVIAEALMLGLASSLLGVVLGVGFAKLLNLAFHAVGFGLPTAAIAIHSRTVVVPLLVGTVVAVVAAAGPAVRSTRVAPVAALREGATLPPSRIHPYIPFLAAGIGGLGLLAVIQSLFGSGSTSGKLLSLAAGAMLIFLAVAMVSRYVVRPMARVIGWPLERMFRMTGRMARENAMRNPGRTAVTSAALMIGVGLVVFVAVFANGLKSSFLGALDRSIKSDLIIQASNNGTQIPAAATRVAASVPGVSAAAAIKFDQAKIGNGGLDTINGVDPATFGRVYVFDWQNGGSNALLQRLTGNAALVEEQFAKSHHLGTGDTFQVTSRDGVHLALRVVGQYKDPTLMTGFIVNSQTYDSFSSAHDIGVLLVDFTNHQPSPATQKAVATALKQF